MYYSEYNTHSNFYINIVNITIYIVPTTIQMVFHTIFNFTSRNTHFDSKLLVYFFFVSLFTLRLEFQGYSVTCDENFMFFLEKNMID